MIRRGETLPNAKTNIFNANNILFGDETRTKLHAQGKHVVMDIHIYECIL